MSESDSKDRPLSFGLLIALPLFALLVYGIWQVTNQSGSSLNGVKLMPPGILSDMVLVDADNQALPATLFKDKWSYVVFAESECDDACEQQLLITREVANSATDVQRVLVLAHEPTDEFIKRISAENPQLVIAVLTRPIWTIFIVQFQSAIEEVGGAPYFLVNPNGLVIVGYDDLASAQDVISDLQSLLKQS